MRVHYLLILLILGLGCQQSSTTKEETTPEEVTEAPWIQLFNGKDMTGWTQKISGYDYGDNFGNRRIRNLSSVINHIGKPILSLP